MTPTKEQFQRSNAKSWLQRFATPEILELLYDELKDLDCPYDRKMISKVYQDLTGEGLK